MSTLLVESSVKQRYAAGAHAREVELCCPVDYDPKFLQIIPQEVIERDYGCGDPSKYVRPGETVLDLGSGTGKICFIASQVVGPTGRVIGVDMTDEMLEVARRNAPVVAERTGYANVEFKKGRIQDLGLDLELFEKKLSATPIQDANGFLSALENAEELRRTQPLVADESVDVVVSNCVLNLVGNADRQMLFRELFRVLKVGGRAVISDIVSDEVVPAELQNDAELWSGCISGAFGEEAFLQAFRDAGFVAVRILKLDPNPWRTVQGIEFRSMTVEAYKPSAEPCMEANQTIIYQGPFASATDDEGKTYQRGVRYAVCARTFQLFQKAYAGHFQMFEPAEAIAPEKRELFDCSSLRRRDPRELKGLDFRATTPAQSCCAPGTNCC